MTRSRSRLRAGAVPTGAARARTSRSDPTSPRTRAMIGRYGWRVSRRRRPRDTRPLPPPLPPETRTVGQLVAEAVRFYGAHFWRSLALGLGPAAVTVAAYEIGWHPALAAVGVAYLGIATSSYIAALLLVSGRRPERRVLLT